MRVRWLMSGLLIAMLVSALAPIGTDAANLLSITSTSTTIYGGKSASASIKLDAAAPAGGQVITLQSSNTALATLPASVTILAGRTSTSATIKTYGVATSGTVVISASIGGTTKSLTFTINPAAMGSLSIPKTVAGGAAAKGTVNLYGVAPAGGIVVSLSATGAADVPSTVTVLAGRASATFPITSSPVTSSSSSTITATYKGVSKSGSITVTPAALSVISFAPTTIGDGITSRGTVKLNGPAASGGARVTLSVPSNSPISIPSSVTIPAGALSATFTVTGDAVTSLTSIVVTGAYSTTKTATIKVSPAALSGIKYSPISIAYNGTATGTVTLTTPAPAGGAVVSLSSNSSALTLPASVTVPAGSKTATFTATAQAPGVRTSTRTTATYAGVSKTVTLSVGAAPVTMIELVALPNPTGSGSPTGIGIGLSGPAATGGFPISVTSSNPTLVPITGSYTILQGTTSVAIVRITGTTTTDQTVRISVTGGGKTMSVDILVKPYALYDMTVPVSMVGGSTRTGTVRLTGPAPAGGVLVNLDSTNPGAASVPSAVTVPAGQLQTTFSVTTTAQAAATNVTITATAGGTEVTGTIAVNLPQILGYGTFPSQTWGGQSVSGVVTINADPPAGGIQLQVTSSDPLVASVPSTVTVSSGTSTNIPVTTNPVTTAKTVTITSTLNGSTAVHTITVLPATLNFINLGSTQFTGGQTINVEVALKGKANTNGFTATLTSSNPSLVPLPASVTFAPGEQSKTLQVALAQPVATTAVVITATAGSTTVTRSFSLLRLQPTGWLSENPVNSNTSFTRYLELSGPAPSGGLVIALTYSNGMVTGPASVVVPAGMSSVAVSLQSLTVSTETDVVLTATASGTSVTTIQSVRPPWIQEVTLTPWNPVGGEPVTVTVTYSSAATAGGMAITVTSDSPYAIIPTGLVLPEGQTTTSFTISTLEVPSRTVVRITVRSGQMFNQLRLLQIEPMVSGAEVIEEPVATEAPVTPEATPEPVVTEAPVTEMPAEPTAEPTEVPTAEATATPEVTEEPVATEPPAATAEPEPPVEEAATPAA